MRRQKFLLFRVYRFQDAKSYGELYDHYYPRIRRHITFKLPSLDDVDELTADVFLRGWEYATSSRVENANALFFKIARNLIADFYRARKVTEPMTEAENVASGKELLEELMVEEEHKVLLRNMNVLREEYKDVLVMRYLDQMSVREIGEALDKAPNNVRVLIHRAKKALKEISR